MNQLTPEQIVLGQMIADGLTYKEIGDRLGISPSTAKLRTSQLRWALGVQRKRQIPGVMRELGYFKS